MEFTYHDSDAVDDDEKKGRRDSWKAITMPPIAGGDPPALRLEEQEYMGEPEVIFHSESLEYLERNGPFLIPNGQELEKNCSALLKIADSVKILPPPDDPLPWDILDM